MTRDEVARAVFAAECVSPNATVELNGGPAAILTDAGRAVRLAVTGKFRTGKLGHYYESPLSAQIFRSMMSPVDPVFSSREFSTNSIAALDATVTERETLWNVAEQTAAEFFYEIDAPIPDSQFETPPKVELTENVRAAIESVPFSIRSSLIEIFAPQLWCLSHRPSWTDFLGFECVETPWEKDSSAGYVQFKGCGGTLDRFGRRWLYGESMSIRQKEACGMSTSRHISGAAEVLGWRNHEINVNNFCAFCIDGPIQAAMLAEMVVDTLICVHDLQNVYAVNLTLIKEGAETHLTSCIKLPKMEPM